RADKARPPRPEPAPSGGRTPWCGCRPDPCAAARWSRRTARREGSAPRASRGRRRAPGRPAHRRRSAPEPTLPPSPAPTRLPCIARAPWGARPCRRHKENAPRRAERLLRLDAGVLDDPGVAIELALEIAAPFLRLAGNRLHALPIELGDRVRGRHRL